MDDLIIILCITQSNSDFILTFAQKAALLKKWTHHDIHFKWKPVDLKSFENLQQDFKKGTLL